MHKTLTANRQMTCILLTNDDGFWSEGLTTLKRELSRHWDVVVIAPDREQSAKSHSLTLTRPLRVNRIEEDVFSVDGTPSDCVMLGTYGLLDKKPDLVVSGINHGANLGDDVTYSGTVAAAMEGTLLGIPSIAISVVGEDKLIFDQAAEFAVHLIEKILQEGMPEETLLNVNVPNLPKDRLKGVKITKSGKRIYRDGIVKNTDPRGKPYYWIGGQDPTWIDGDETDFAAVEEGMISILPLHLDLTKYKAIGEMENWRIEL